VAPLLEVNDLKTYFRTDDGVVRAVDGVSFSVDKGQTLGIVGESGSGKSVTCLTIMGLNPKRSAISSGTALWKGEDLLTASPRRLREIRGSEIAMIFQDPMTSLNPVHKIGDQLGEAMRLHEDVSKKTSRKRALELLKAVGIPRPEKRLDDYPHQFSGGMRQRVMIAMALSCNPDLLIADEPTTALDVTIQAQILELLKRLKADFGSAVVLITHDMGVVAEIADTINVMYAGEIVERGSKRELFANPQHPYTWGLLGSIPRLDRPKPRRLVAIQGQPPSMVNPPAGCRFAPRCANRFEACDRHPSLEPRAGAEHLDRCWLTVEEKEARRAAAIDPALSEPA
jgi:oligopeptide/dipeptide ABC transporter ATP-binding protein